jgi:hypothetical protein
MQPNPAAVGAGKGWGEPSHARKDQTGQTHMKDHSASPPGLEPAPGTAQDDAADLLHGEQLFRSWLPRNDSGTDDDDTDDDDTSRLPTITGLPEGIEVVEHEIARAVGQWILMVRCQCGKRWFELEAIDTATCPRCNKLVYVDAVETRRD